MSFVEEFNSLPLAHLHDASMNASEEAVRRVLSNPQPGLADFAVLISPAAGASLESMCQKARAMTQKRFGKVIRLFAPLYLSNECINNCKYCGFSRDNPILRVTLSLEEVAREAKAIVDQGFRNILLVAGEHPKFVSQNYLRDCVQLLHKTVPSLSLEVGPMETDEYRELVLAGVDGLTIYQETYERDLYADLHTSGPKRDFDYRLETPERAYAAGIRRLGIAALYGLGAWRREALSVAAHGFYLLKHCWKSSLTISLPRLRPHAGSFEPLTQISDREMVQLTAAYRLCFPDVGLVLSTRERSSLRDGLIQIGITMMSAGSHTEPGGYTGAGREKLHLTERGHIRPPVAEASSEFAADRPSATAQFEIADSRSPHEIARLLARLGYEPVWKDWDTALTETALT
jgi:2-iminoacetate synthase